ncbi:hypothetical protein GCM10010199_01170 [Dactylosporangium roseum]
MATVRDKVVQYLQDARAAEYALTTMLAVNIAVTPEGTIDGGWRRSGDGPVSGYPGCRTG